MNTLILEHVPLARLSTFKMGGTARFVAYIKSLEDLIFALKRAEEEKLSVSILGGGSNTLFGDGLINIFFLKIEILGIEKIQEDSESVSLKIGAGESWDKVVEYAGTNGWAGIEALSLIPGTTGATPVQNVGAYGQEIKDTLVSVEAYDIHKKEVVEIIGEACGFAYRSSIFKQKDSPFIILSVILKLSKQTPIIPQYPDVIKYFAEKQITESSLLDIRKAIIEIRTRKFDLEKEPSVGSFFKNTVVTIAKAEELKKQFGDMPQFRVGDEVKIPSGWLIEQVGFKGRRTEKVGVSEKSALVLINTGEATLDDLKLFRDEIIEKVFEKFGIQLEQEPVVVE